MKPSQERDAMERLGDVLERQRLEASDPIRRRTTGERDAYVDGLKAGVKFVSDELRRQHGLDANHYAVSQPVERARQRIDLIVELGEVDG